MRARLDLLHTFKVILLDILSGYKTFAYSRYPIGIVIGKLPIIKRYVCSLPESEEHLLFAAPSGSGKTAGPVIMTLQAITLSIFDRFNAFVIDISGDIHSNVPGEKLFFAPFDDGGHNYNVFDRIDRLDNELRDLEIMRMTQLIYSDYQPGGNSAAIYYGEGGLTILQAAMIAGYRAGRDFIDICKAVYTSSAKELIEMIELYPFADNLIKDYKDKDVKDLAKFKENLNKTVAIFATDPRVAKSFGRGPDSISPFSLEESSVYICIPDEQLVYSKQLMHVITAQVVDYLLSREYSVAACNKPKILLCLDELTSLGHLGNLCALLQRTRKHGTRIMILTQDLSDLEMVYPHEYKSMLGNLTIKVVLGGLSELDSMNYISDMIGKYSIDESEKKFFEPEDIRMLSKKKEIVIFSGGHMVINKARWFKDFNTIKDTKTK